MPNYKNVVLALSLTVLFIGIAVATSIVPGSDGVLFWRDDGNSSVDVNERLKPASVDANVEFPDALSELPGTPTHVAVDPVSGDLLFVLFSYGTTPSGDNILYRYSKSDETVETRSIPASTGSELFSAIEIDGRGHVIFVEGDLVLDVDPDGSYTEHRLPAPTDVVSGRGGFAGTYVIDMALSDSGKAYLTRMNTDSITELDFATGATREISLPPSLGQVFLLELSGTSLWMTTWLSLPDFPVKTAVLDTSSEVLEIASTTTTSLAADSAGRLYAEDNEDNLIRIDSASPLARSDFVSFDIPNSGAAFLSIDDVRDRIWMAGGGPGGIVSLDASTSQTEQYVLPSFPGVMLSGVRCVFRDCDGGANDSFTLVRGIAVAPNGDLYFSDGSYNRIGIVHPR